MGQELAPGSRWASIVDETEVIVMRAGPDGISLHCGGHEMLPTLATRPSGRTLDPALPDETVVGKRYAHDSGLEVLCTRSGYGVLTIDGVPLWLENILYGYTPLAELDES